MKKLFYLLMVVSFLAACSGPKETVKTEPKKTVKIEPKVNESQEDSVEYELIVLDPGFETWYMLQNSPARYRSQEYYENWNHQYVTPGITWLPNPARDRSLSLLLDMNRVWITGLS